MKKLIIGVGLVFALSACGSASTMSPERAASLRALVSSGAAGAQSEIAAEGALRDLVREHMGLMAVAVKTYTDLGYESGDTSPSSFLEKVESSFANVASQAESWSAFTATLPAPESSSLNMMLLLHVRMYSDALGAWAKQQEDEIGVMRGCLSTNSQLNEVNLCAANGIDLAKREEVFNDYLSALKNVMADLGMKTS